MEVEEKEVRGEEEKMDKEEERRDGHALDESECGGEIRCGCLQNTEKWVGLV